jgi:hypothetical protein
LEKELRKLKNHKSKKKIIESVREKKSKSVSVDSEESNVYFSVPGDKEPQIPV